MAYLHKANNKITKKSTNKMEKLSESTVLPIKKVSPKNHHYVETASGKRSWFCNFQNLFDGRNHRGKIVNLTSYHKRSGQHLPSPQQCSVKNLSQSNCQSPVTCTKKGSRGPILADRKNIAPSRKSSSIGNLNVRKVILETQSPPFPEKNSTRKSSGSKDTIVDKEKPGKLGCKTQRKRDCQQKKQKVDDIHLLLPPRGGRKLLSECDQNHHISEVNKPVPVDGKTGTDCKVGTGYQNAAATRLELDNICCDPASDYIPECSYRNHIGQVVKKADVRLSGSNSKLYNQEHLKSVLNVLRSSLSPEEKLHAIKCNRDHWNELHHKQLKEVDAEEQSRRRLIPNVNQCLIVENVTAVDGGSLYTEANQTPLPTADNRNNYNNRHKMTSPNEELSAVEMGKMDSSKNSEVLSLTTGQAFSDDCHSASATTTNSKQIKNELNTSKQDLYSNQYTSASYFTLCQPIKSNLKKKRYEDEGGDVRSELDLGQKAPQFASAYHVVNGNLSVPLQAARCSSADNVCQSDIVSDREYSVIKMVDSVQGARLCFDGRVIRRAMSWPDVSQNKFQMKPVDNQSGRCVRNALPPELAVNLDYQFHHGNCDPFICDVSLERSLQAVRRGNSKPMPGALFHSLANDAQATYQYFMNRTIGGDSKEKKSCEFPSKTNSKLKCSLSPVIMSLDIKDGSLETNQNNHGPPKSPVTVQEWVDSINVVDHRHEDGPEISAKQTQVLGNEGDDNLGLGAEAYHEFKKEVDNSKAQIRHSNQMVMYGQTRDKNNSFRSETSGTSTCSISSVEALLETMQHNPEEILLGLGFGSAAPDPLTRIPERFLHSSQVRGNNLQEFLKKQQEMSEMYDMGFCGYRGLSGFSLDGHGPSGIVFKILEKIRDRNRELKRALTPPNSSVSQPSLSFYRAAFSLMAVNAFRSPIKNSSSSSILERENREFLDNQEGSIKAFRKKRPRLVLGKDSYALDTDEELIADDHDRSLSPNHLQLKGSSGNNGTVRELDSVGSSVSPTYEPNRKMSDDVFVPTDNKPSFWGILRSMRMPSNGPLSPPRVYSEARGSLNPEESSVQTPNADSSASGNSIFPPVFGETCKRSSRLIRQASVEFDQSSEMESLTSPRRHPKLGSVKMETAGNKDSFELEELPGLSDIQDGDIMDQAGRLHVNNEDVPRTGSAMSDSSGFLEGETLEVSNEMLEDTLLNFVLSENSDAGSPTPKGLQESITTDSFAISSDISESWQMKMPYDGEHTGIASNCKTNSERRSPLLVMNHSESGFESFGTQEKDDISCMGIGEGNHSPVGYLSESDTTVIDAASSSSSDALPILRNIDENSSQNLNHSLSNLPHSKNATMDTCSVSIKLSKPWPQKQQHCYQSQTLAPETCSKVDVSKCISEMDLTYAQSSLRYLGCSDINSSLENISNSDDSSAFTKMSSNVIKGGELAAIRSFQDLRLDESHDSGAYGKIGEFHKSCLLVVHRMQDVLQLYQKKLKEMERSCLDTCQHLYTGITQPEREELEKLSDLRKLILEETNKTQLLLSNRSKTIKSIGEFSHHSRSPCDDRLVTVAKELGELLNEQNVFLKQLDDVHNDLVPLNATPCQHPSSAVSALCVTSETGDGDRLHSLLQNMKQEMMIEIRNILQGDREKFQSVLTTTQQGIEDVKSVLTGLLSSLHSDKT